MRRLVVLGAALLACRPTVAPMPTTAPATAATLAGGGPDTVRQAAIAVRSDAGAIAAIVREGTGASSRAEADLAYLTDVIGPRLTGTDGMRRANEWTVRKFREYGMDSTWLEAWRFGRGWQRGPMTLRMVMPHERWLIGFSWAWAPGTNGPLVGPVVMLDARTEAEFAERYAGKLRGAWVMTSPAMRMWNPDGPPMTARDSAARDSVRRALFRQPDQAQLSYRRRIQSLLAAEGIAGVVNNGAKEFSLLTMSGSPSVILPFPTIVIPAETYMQFQRLLSAGESVRLEANISNSFGSDSVTQYNTVAELRGTERPDEVVLLGAHLDSWDLATGTTDNASGSIAVLEAARILKSAGVRPRRTIRFALFSGEEQGLFGSVEYANAHAAELARYQAVLVLDNGSGRIIGMSLQGRNELGNLWRDLFAPVNELGPFQVQRRNKGGTDHLPFLEYGVPAFNYDQLPRGYDHTHHSQVDTFDHGVPADVAQAATVMAATAYGLANLVELLPRGRMR
ncbi:MAG: M20/M25/M40 family metallo-hydrolase [Gemmatimonadaceae bacterium]